MAVRALAELWRRTTPTPGWSWWAVRAAPMARRNGPAVRPGIEPGWAWPTGSTLVPPQPHELLSTYYRAADVCLVPSRSESFGLVALEAAACGTPVVASAVGRPQTLVDHGRTGFLVEDPTPEGFAGVDRGSILAEPLLAERLGTGAVLRARRLHLGPRRRPAAARSTTSSPPGASWSARDRPSWCGRSPEAAERQAVVRSHRRLDRAGAGRRRTPWWRPSARRVGTRSTGAPRWYLRFKGEEKDFITVWLTLRQRTLHHEAQFMPAPETNIEADVAVPAARNADLFGMAFALGPEDAVYLVGRVPAARVDDDELDRIVGASLAYIDDHFPTAMTLGYEGCTGASTLAALAGPGPVAIRAAGPVVGRW